MQSRRLFTVVLILIAVVRVASALIPSRSTHHESVTAASSPPDVTTAMADAQQQFRQVPDNIRTSHGGEIMLSDGTTRELGDNPADQAIRDRFANITEAANDEAWGPKPVPYHTPGPGEPMMEPTPSR